MTDQERMIKFCFFQMAGGRMTPELKADLNALLDANPQFRSFHDELVNSVKRKSLVDKIQPRKSGKTDFDKIVRLTTLEEIDGGLTPALKADLESLLNKNPHLKEYYDNPLRKKELDEGIIQAEFEIDNTSDKEKRTFIAASWERYDKNRGKAHRLK